MVGCSHGLLSDERFSVSSPRHYGNNEEAITQVQRILIVAVSSIIMPVAVLAAVTDQGVFRAYE
ncbi:hypothetical protein [Parendozoicomonas haliclonae]|uniref:hypothetical protein n=1 Tax=Parendozoicomonas haliclonae TaxID=1960125 RepID=UPI001054422A|nr:hypothetical protein [Parendozoicomonas haliclonae]